MEPKPKYQMSMLALAEKGGEVMYQGLRKKCPKCNGDKRIPQYLDGEPPMVICHRCSGSGFIPNPDLGTLIAAAHKQIWEVRLLPTPNEPYFVGLFSHGELVGALGIGATKEAALIHSMFKATEAAEPDNWGKCKDCVNGKIMNFSLRPGDSRFPAGSHDCLDCHGIGKVEVQV